MGRVGQFQGDGRFDEALAFYGYAPDVLAVTAEQDGGYPWYGGCKLRKSDYMADRHQCGCRHAAVRYKEKVGIP